MADADSFTFVIEGGAPWGFRLQGGSEFRAPLRISAITPRGKASKTGLQVRDYIRNVNEVNCDGLRHNEAQKLVKASGSVLRISVSRDCAPPVSPREPITPVKKSSPHFPLAPRPPVITAEAHQQVVRPVERRVTPVPKSIAVNEIPTIQQSAVNQLPAATQHTTSAPVAKDTVDDALFGPLPTQSIISQQKKAFDPPVPVGRGSWRRTSGSDVTNKAQITTEANSSSVEMQIAPGPTQSSQVIKPVSTGTTSGAAKPTGWYRDMFKSMHVTADPRFSGDGSSGFRGAKDEDTKQDQPVKNPNTVLSSSHPPPVPHPAQQSVPSSKADTAVSDLSKPMTPRTTAPPTSTTPKTTTSYQPVAKVTVGGFQDAEAIIRQHKGQSGTQSAPRLTSVGKLASGAGSVYKMLQAGGDIPEKGLAALPREESPPTQRKAVVHQQKSASPPNVATSVKTATSSTTSTPSPTTQPSVTHAPVRTAAQPVERPPSVHLLREKFFSPPAERPKPAVRSPTGAAIRSQGIEAIQPISIGSAAVSGSKQEDSLHTSSLVVQVGGSGEPQQVQVGVGNSVSNTQSRQEEPKQELAIVGKTEAMQQLTAAAPTKSQETDKRLSPTSPTIHESPEMKSPIEGKGTAKALYTFKAEMSKELEFKKGAVLALVREVDQNWLEGELNGKKGIFPKTYVEIIVPVPKASPSRPPQPVSVTANPSEPTARAKFKFEGDTSVELSFKKGDIISIIRRVDDNWYEGKIGARRGIFPASYVVILQDLGKKGSASRESVRRSSSGSQVTTSQAMKERKSSSSGASGSRQQQSVGSRDQKQSVKKGGPPDRPAQPPSRTPSVLQQKYQGEKYRAVYSYTPENKDELELAENDEVVVVEKCDDGWFVGTCERTGKFGTFPGNFVEKDS